MTTFHSFELRGPVFFLVFGTNIAGDGGDRCFSGTLGKKVNFNHSPSLGSSSRLGGFFLIQFN